MSFTVQGWCPGALRPMASGDGLVVRVRPRCGRLSPDQARALAGLARDHGNGLMDVTSRANLQLRGVTPDRHPALIAGLADLGLLDDDARAEARRNVILSPVAPVNSPAWQLAEALSAALGAPDAPDLPGKFGFAVAHADPGELDAVPCDIRLRPVAAGWEVAADGAHCAAPASTVAEAASVALAMARWFVASGGVHEGRGRMAALIARGLVPPMAEAPLTVESELRAQPGPGAVANGWLVGLPFGQMGPDLLAALAGLGAIRLTPWQGLVVEGAARAPALPGLILDPADPLRRVHACTGAPGCPQALAETRALAAQLAARLAPGQSLHLSGCAKGCAYRGRADLVVIARKDGLFDLIDQGRITDPVTRAAVPLAGLPLRPIESPAS